MQIFIDNNVFLSYFHPEADITSLEEMWSLIDKKKASLLVTQQVRDEFYRNVRGRIEEERSKLLRTEYDLLVAVGDKKKRSLEKDDIKKTEDEFRVFFKEKKVEAQENLSKIKNAEANWKKAEKRIDLLLELGTPLEEDEEIIKKAYHRYLKGNPPRKESADKEGRGAPSYGDAITWELLLKEARKDNLMMVLKDKDFTEEIAGEKRIKHFLEKEWGQETTKKISLFSSLGAAVNFLEKKKIIKEAVVKKERAQIDNPLATEWNWVPYLRDATVTGYVSAAPISDTVAFGGIQAAEIYCPYCRTPIQSKGSDLLALTVQFNEKRYVCPNALCLRTFTIKKN